MKCETCNGKGVIELFTSTSKCGDCGGTGEKPLTAGIDKAAGIDNTIEIQGKFMPAPVPAGFWDLKLGTILKVINAKTQ